MTVIIRHPLTVVPRSRIATASSTMHRFSTPAEIIYWPAFADTLRKGIRRPDNRWSYAKCIAFIAATGIAGWIAIVSLIALVA